MFWFVVFVVGFVCLGFLVCSVGFVWCFLFIWGILFIFCFQAFLFLYLWWVFPLLSIHCADLYKDSKKRAVKSSNAPHSEGSPGTVPA